MSGKYCLRERKTKNYEETAMLPRLMPKKRKADDNLYPVEVIEKVGSRVKIHYTGYGSEYDEWRDEKDIVEPATYKPFNFHEELVYQIKLALDSKRKEPEVRIELPFDKIFFDGGLKSAGSFTGCSHGHDVFTIKAYADLSVLLGDGWWYRFINKQMNFCYVNKATVQYYLHQRKAVTEYTCDGQIKTQRMSAPVLIFKFVRMDGVGSDWQTICKN